MADLSLVNLSKSFGAVKAVQPLNLDVASGEMIVLLGPSGAGKTTTLRLIAGLEAADTGQVLMGGRDVSTLAPALRDVAFVFQQYSLYPHLNVYDNLAFPLRSPLRPTSQADIEKRVLHIARLLRIEDKLKQPSTQLSGGQMQRVAIGRALVRSPQLYLMDEPLSSLDARLRNDLRLELKRITQDLGATTIYVTHDQVEALTMASRIGVLDHGQLVQLGTPQSVYENPLTLNVASRLGSPRINLLPASTWPALQWPQAVLTLGIRPEHIEVRRGHRTGVPSRADALASFEVPAQVQRTEHLGDQSVLHVQLAGASGQLTALAQPGHRFEPGSAVDLHIARCFCFDLQGQRIHPFAHQRP